MTENKSCRKRRCTFVQLGPQHAPNILDFQINFTTFPGYQEFSSIIILCVYDILILITPLVSKYL